MTPKFGNFRWRFIGLACLAGPTAAADVTGGLLLLLDEAGPLCSGDSKMSRNGSRIAGCVDAIPEQPVELFEAVRSSDLLRAVEIHGWFVPLLQLHPLPELVQLLKRGQGRSESGLDCFGRTIYPGEHRDRDGVSLVSIHSLFAAPTGLAAGS